MKTAYTEIFTGGVCVINTVNSRASGLGITW